MRIAVVGPLAALMLGLCVPQSFALETSLQYVLTLSGNVERRQVRYDCDGQQAPLIVEYVNAAPNFLAIVPIDGNKTIFASVLSADGARYAAGKNVWWTKGPEASLYDVTKGADAAPVLTCLEHDNTP